MLNLKQRAAALSVTNAGSANVTDLLNPNPLILLFLFLFTKELIFITNELIVIYHSDKDKGIVLIKDRLYHNWKKKDLKKAAKQGFIAGFEKNDPDAYFVIPMSNISCMTLCEGDMRKPSSDEYDDEDDVEIEDETYKGAKPDPNYM